MKTPIIALSSIDKTLVASSISRPDKTQITIQPLHDLQELSEILSSNIEFQNGESISTFKWLRLKNTSPSKQSVSKKRRNSNSLESTTTLDSTNIQYIDYLVILLHTGEILIYSTFTKEFINKISTDSAFCAIDVINKIGHSEKSLYKYDYDVITFDSNDSSLKFFSSISPQLIDSVPFDHDPSISYILFNEDILEAAAESKAPELFLASGSTLYLLDDHHELMESINISLSSSSAAKKVSKNSNTSNDSVPVRKIVKDGSKLLIVHHNSSIVQIVDLDATKKSKGKHQLLNASSVITDISVINAESKSPIISATVIDGSIELFHMNQTSSFAQLQIKGGNDVGKFVGLMNSEAIVDEVYKGIWYDNFVIRITDFEFDNINNLNGNITIAVGDSENDDTDLLEFVSAEEGDFDEEPVDVDDLLEHDGKNIGDENANSDDDNDDEIAETHSFECEDLAQFSKLLKSKLKTLIPEDTEEFSLTEILSQNTIFAKPTIHILSVEESNLLFGKVAFIISHYSNSFNQDFTVISNIKEWFKWLLILRGSVITQSEESVEWLKLMQSELKQEAKNLNNMIKLTGKLTLLRDQLSVRNEMLNKNVEIHDEDSENDNTLNNDGTSVVLDGEGGFDEDLDSDNNAEPVQESGDEDEE